MSDERSPLRVVLCWHMHQPDYRGPAGGGVQLPWVYLHALKDYSDMASHLEAQREARAVVNFAPILLEQLADYAEQIRAWVERGRQIRDPLLAALAGPGLPLDTPQRSTLVQACLRANPKHLIDRFPAFKELAELARWVQTHEHTAAYLNDQFLSDLLVWYHLAWMGEDVRQNDLRVQSLQKKKRGYTPEDRRQLVILIGDLVAQVVPRYRRLAEQGRVELSVTPYAHPILPLLLDLDSAREAMPDIELPELAEYPGGEARARWHVREGLAAFERHFGFRPRGCWPSEGALSEDTLRILNEEGFLWTASGQAVLHNSLSAALRDEEEPLERGWLYRGYRVNEGRTLCFFRDDGLSDLIGFTYADWHADDAVANLVEHLEAIDESTQGLTDRVVSIIMDGENAWEYFPHNGSFFLSELYRRLAQHNRLHLTTYAELLAQRTQPPPELDRLVTGSWVYGSLSTWIGDPDKNRAWDMLGEAKAVYDRVLAERRLSDERRRAAEMQLATCEGSDWFWWFGDYNPGETVSDFERLFRHQLTHLYRLLGETPPKYLFSVFAVGSGRPELGGVMRKN
jgi:alpha-amylase/alpha-mannosidase (GH57 family)